MLGSKKLRISWKPRIYLEVSQSIIQLTCSILGGTDVKIGENCMVHCAMKNGTGMYFKLNALEQHGLYSN